MTRAMLLPAALSLQIAAGAVVAQSPAPQTPAPQSPAAQQPAASPAPQAPERQPLNLRLDDTSRRQIMSGARNEETGSGPDSLPTLGGDARRIERARGAPATAGVPGAPNMGDGRGID